MAIRKNADGTVTVGIIPAARKAEATPAVAEKSDAKKPAKKSEKK